MSDKIILSSSTGPFKPFKTSKCFLFLFGAARKLIALGLIITRQSASEKHYSLVCYILWVFYTSKKPIGILNLKPWTEFDFTPLNRYLRPQLSFISEETLIVSSVTLSSALEMLSNPVNLPCGTKCWREFNIFWSGYFAFVLFIIIVIIIIIILLKLISAVVKDWFFSLGTIYFCVFQEVVFNCNFRVNLHVEIQVKIKKRK